MYKFSVLMYVCIEELLYDSPENCNKALHGSKVKFQMSLSSKHSLCQTYNANIQTCSYCAAHKREPSVVEDGKRAAQVKRTNSV